MKYSQQLGIVFCLLLIAACYLPWAFIPSLNFEATGMNSDRLGYGKPGLMHMILCIISIVLFLISKAGAKRVNPFVTAINFAWCVRNFTLYSTCSAGECPVRKWALFLTLLLSFGIFVMSMLPTIKIKREDAFKQ